MSSLKRILSLAKRTGGPVVIYDAETGNDFVLQSGWLYDLQTNFEESADASKEHTQNWEDELKLYSTDTDSVELQNDYTYEAPKETVSRAEPYFEFERRILVEEMDPRELLSQINRDIASWKSYQDEESEVQRAYALEEELIVADEESVEENWATPASVFEHYSSALGEFNEPLVRIDRGMDSLQTPEQYKGMQQTEREDLAWEEDEHTWSDIEPLRKIEDETTPQIEQISLEDVPFDPPMVETVGEKESLVDSDAPVFYTEPVL